MVKYFAKHGGKREGSGPKPMRGVSKVTTSIAVTPELQAYLRQAEPSQSEAIEVAIRRTKGFKDWVASQDGSP